MTKKLKIKINNLINNITFIPLFFLIINDPSPHTGLLTILKN